MQLNEILDKIAKSVSSGSPSERTTITKPINESPHRKLLL